MSHTRIQISSSLKRFAGRVLVGKSKLQIGWAIEGSKGAVGAALSHDTRHSEEMPCEPVYCLLARPLCSIDVPTPMASGMFKRRPFCSPVRLPLALLLYETVRSACEATRLQYCKSNRAVFAPEVGQVKFLATALSKGCLFSSSLVLLMLFLRLSKEIPDCVLYCSCVLAFVLSKEPQCSSVIAATAVDLAERNL